MPRRQLHSLFCWGVLIALALFVAFPALSVAADSSVHEFSTYRWGISGYKENLYMLVDQMGRGSNSWTIPAGTTAHYNDRIGSLGSAGAAASNYAGQTYNHINVGNGPIPAGGACDVASWFNAVAISYGLPTSYSSRHPAVSNVPAGQQVLIWRYSNGSGNDLEITNNTGSDITFHWETTDSSVRMWIDGNSEGGGDSGNDGGNDDNDDQAGGGISEPEQSKEPEPAPAPTESPSAYIDPNTIDWGYTQSGGGPVDTSSLQWETNKRSPIEVPAWAYVSVPLSILTVFFRKVRPLGFAGLAVTAIIIFGFYFTEPVLAEPPPQMVYIAAADITVTIPKDKLVEPTVVAQAPVAEQPAAQPVSEPEKQKQESVSVPEGDCQVSSKFPENITRWCVWITKYSLENGLDPNMFAATMLQESGGNPEAMSYQGATGLMQIMPRDGVSADFMCINGPCFANRPSIQELLDPEYNIAFSARMLRGLGGDSDFREALFHYGPSGVGYAGYADKIMAIYQRYK